VILVNRSCKKFLVPSGLLIGLILFSTALLAVQAFVPKPIPTPVSKIYYYRYHVTQNVLDYAGQTKTSEFDEVYRIQFLDDKKINYTSTLDYTFYISCGASNTNNWYFESIVDSESRLINQTVTYSDPMDYLNTHIRLYAPSGIIVSGKMPSNNIEVGYRWGIKPPLHDLNMTRMPDFLYTIGLNTLEVLNFYGYEQQLNISIG
jgi:hypothetical protein